MISRFSYRQRFGLQHHDLLLRKSFRAWQLPGQSEVSVYLHMPPVTMSYRLTRTVLAPIWDGARKRS